MLKDIVVSLDSVKDIKTGLGKKIKFADKTFVKLEKPYSFLEMDQIISKLRHEKIEKESLAEIAVFSKSNKAIAFGMRIALIPDDYRRVSTIIIDSLEQIHEMKIDRKEFENRREETKHKETIQLLKEFIEEQTIYGSLEQHKKEALKNNGHKEEKQKGNEKEKEMPKEEVPLTQQEKILDDGMDALESLVIGNHDSTKQPSIAEKELVVESVLEEKEGTASVQEPVPIKKTEEPIAALESAKEALDNLLNFDDLVVPLKEELLEEEPKGSVVEVSKQKEVVKELPFIEEKQIEIEDVFIPEGVESEEVIVQEESVIEERPVIEETSAETIEYKDRWLFWPNGEKLTTEEIKEHDLMSELLELVKEEKAKIAEEKEQVRLQKEEIKKQKQQVQSQKDQLISTKSKSEREKNSIAKSRQQAHSAKEELELQKEEEEKRYQTIIEEQRKIHEEKERLEQERLCIEEEKERLALARKQAEEEAELEEIRLASEQLEEELRREREQMQKEQAILERVNMQAESERIALQRVQQQIEAEKLALERTKQEAELETLNLERTRQEIENRKIIDIRSEKAHSFKGGMIATSDLV